MRRGEIYPGTIEDGGFVILGITSQMIFICNVHHVYFGGSKPTSTYGRPDEAKAPTLRGKTASATRMELAMQGFRGMRVGNRPQ